MPSFLRLFSILLLACLSMLAHGERLRLVSDDWAPYIHFADGQAQGLHHQEVDEVFRRLGVEVQWQYMPWRRCLAMVEQGLADGVLDIFQTPARRQYMIFPDEPMSEVEFVLFQHRARTHAVQRLDDLAGLVVGVSPGYDYGRAFAEARQFRREAAPNHEANLGKLMLGRIDLMVTDRQVGHYLLHKLGWADVIEQLPMVISRRAQYLGLRRTPGNEQLAKQFAVGLRQLREETAGTAVGDAQRLSLRR